MFARKNYTPPFLPSAIPAWRCPRCDGALAIARDSLKMEETAESRKSREHPDWDPEWIEERFSALLKCTRCFEPVFFVGSVDLVEVHDERTGFTITEALRPTFFEPAFPLIHVPEACPAPVKSEIIGASRHFWSSPSAAGNRIRSAVECLLDDQGVSRNAKGKAGKLVRKSLSTRIDQFKAKNPDIAEKFHALRWLGNTGTHSESLSETDVLDAFELLAHALEELYEDRSRRLARLASTIIRRKGRSAKRKRKPGF